MKYARILVPAAVVLGITFALIFVFSQGDKRTVKNVVIAYNDVLQKALFEMKPKMMEKLTTPMELSKIDNYMAYLLKNRKSLASTVKEITFQDVSINGDDATVTTREVWDYHYVDPDSKKPISKAYSVIYGNVYKLKKMEGHWVVNDLESKEIGGKTEG